MVEGATRESRVIRFERVGTVIGEMAVLEATVRSATVVDADPAVAEGVIRTLARRIQTGASAVK